MSKKYYQLLVLFSLAIFITVGFLKLSKSPNQKNILAYNDQAKIISQNSGNAEHPDMAVNSNGDGVIVWQEKLKNWDIFAQRINKDGEKTGNVFQVNQYSVNDQKFPKTSINKDGNFVIVWQSYLQDGNGSGVYGQKFKANGRKWGSEFKVNSFPLNNQILPDVAMNDSGFFVVAWVSEYQDDTPKSIYAKIFNPDGTPITNEIEVNLLKKRGTQTNPKVAINSKNQILIVWQSCHENDWDIHAQALNLNGGRLLKEELLVNDVTDFDQTQPNITVTSSGNFIVAWSNKKSHPILETVMENIEGKVLNGMGQSISSSFVVTEPIFGHHDNPSVSSENGYSAIAWQSFDKENWQIWIQRLDSNNNLFGAPFKLADENQPDREMPAIATDSQSNYHMVWASFVNTEKKQRSIFYKRF